MTNPAHPLARRLLPLDPVLAELPPALLHSVLHQHTQRLALPGGQPLFSEGQPCQGFLVLLPGEVRVARGAWRVARGAWRVARGAWRPTRLRAGAVPRGAG